MTRTARITLAAGTAVALFGAGLGVAVAITRGSGPATVSMMPAGTASMMNGAGSSSCPVATGGAGMMNGGTGMMHGAGAMMNGAGGMMGGGTGMMSGCSATGSAPAAIAGARAVTVTADDLRFSPATLAVRSGEAVNVTLTNTDDVVHDITIPMLGIHAVAQPGSSVTFGLRVSSAGTYPFFCSVPGHAQGGMRGTLTVSA